MRKSAWSLLSCLGFILVLPVSLLAQGTGTSDGRATYHEFPQIAFGALGDGTYYESTLLVTEWSTTVGVNCIIEAKGAAPVFEDIVGATQAAPANFSLVPGGWGVYKIRGNVPFQSGALTLNCSSEVTAQVLYSYFSSTGTKLGEATVFSSPRGNMLQLTIDQREGARLAIAVLNGNAGDEQVDIRIFDPAFQVVGSNTQVIPGMTNIALFVDELSGVTLPNNFVGTVMVTTQGPPPVSMIGLRFTGQVFTTIPSTLMGQVPG